MGEDRTEESGRALDLAYGGSHRFDGKVLQVALVNVIEKQTDSHGRSHCGDNVDFEKLLSFDVISITSLGA